MNQEVAHKRPAQVVTRRPAPQGQVRQVANLAAPTKAELLAALGRQQRAGLIESTNGEIRLITEGQRAGWYAVRVTRMPPRHAAAAPWPSWSKTCISIGAALAGLAALGLAGAWVLTAMDRVSLVAAVVTVLGMFGVWVWAKYGRRRDRSVVVGVRVEVR